MVGDLTETESEEDLFSNDTAEDDSLLKRSKDDSKLSGKAWGRVKNIVSRHQQYPVSIFFILGNEFCERFSYYGMRAILVLYLTRWLKFDDDLATSIFHSFIMLCYFSPLFGAIIADGYLGRYRTILYVSVIYAIGNLVVATTAIPPPEWIGPVIGLILIGLGTGGIKPCVSAFGADQFRQEQEKERNTFFSAFYFMINLGSMFSIIITPMLRGDVHCFGNECYPLAFGVPAALMFLATLIFILGSSMYKRVPPSGNLIGRVVRCIVLGIGGKIKHRNDAIKKDHWLDYAESKFEPAFVNEVKILLKVLFMFIPLPLFWALFDQQGSRWTLQAEKLDGDLGPFGYLKPDQLSALNPALILILIPVFEKLLYPVLDKCKILNRPLQRMVAGMFLGGIAFVAAAVLQMAIEKNYEEPLAATETGVTFINTLDCDIQVNSDLAVNSVSSLQASSYIRGAPGDYSVRLNGSCIPPNVPSSVITLSGGVAYRLFVHKSSEVLNIFKFTDLRERPSEGKSSISLFSSKSDFNLNISAFSLVADGYTSVVTEDSGLTFSQNDVFSASFKSIDPGLYKVFQKNNSTQSGVWTDTNMAVQFGPGGVYSLYFYMDFVNGTEMKSTLFTSLQSNKISMLWMVPQYFIITAGEVLYSVTGLAFAYSQAPNTMKSVVQAAWLMTTAFGSLIVVIVAQIKLFKTQTAEFFFFAILMGIDTVIFMIMSAFYKYYNTSGEGNHDSDMTDLVRNIEDENEIPLQDNLHPKQT